jgi:nucleoside-diphosphate-sugar epimerase
MMGMFQQDIEEILSSDKIDWKIFYRKTVLITGATGLLGRLITESFLALNRKNQAEIRVILPLRNMQKARAIYGAEGNGLDIREMTLMEIQDLTERADFVIHCAAPTRSAFFVRYPVETMDSILQGTRSVLEYARRVGCQSVVNLSSMEVFGTSSLPVLTEEDLGAVPLTSLRSSYPQAKRMAELMCCSYAAEYSVPVKVARLAQIFGPGVATDDNRVFMQFCCAILEGRDIVLNTTGETVVNYCYTTDAVLGVLTLLLKGESGETYTVVNDDPSYTIRQMAEWLVQAYGKPGQAVRFATGLEGQYAPSSQSKLSNQKIRTLGWTARYSVKDGYARLLSYLGESNAKS